MRTKARFTVRRERASLRPVAGALRLLWPTRVLGRRLILRRNTLQPNREILLAFRQLVEVFKHAIGGRFLVRPTEGSIAALENIEGGNLETEHGSNLEQQFCKPSFLCLAPCLIFGPAEVVQMLLVRFPRGLYLLAFVKIDLDKIQRIYMIW